MDLKGAEVRNYYNLTNEMGGSSGPTAERVKIPHYQRPFKWSKELVGKLIKDWSREDEKKPRAEYFAGSIVTVTNMKKDIKCHELIDGQQRFTTIYLVNYLLFLLLRVTLRQAILQVKQTKIKELKDKLELAIKNSFVTSVIDSLINIDQVVMALESDDDNAKQEILDKYFRDIKLPLIVEGEENYNKSHMENLKEYIEINNSLRLSYDRSSYNASLANALSRVVIKLSDQEYSSVEIDRDGLKDGCIEEAYLDAVQKIFDSFYEIGDDLSKHKKIQDPKYYSINPFNVSLSMIESLSSFLENVKLCVIQTGNQKDAYTLFEVLNDRALALDDLDLIKNQFYRAFCEKCGLSDEIIDIEITQREDQWGEGIFSNNTNSSTKLIAYFATSYLTGSTSIGLKSHDDHRFAISEYLDKCEEYTKDELEVDFNIFQAVKILVDKFGIVTNKRDAKAIEAEFSDKTITYKTVHLLLALGYEGVLAGLMNFILQYIKENGNNSKFEPCAVENFADCLISDKNEHKYIHKQARIIWQCTLTNKDYKKPREIAKNVIIGSNRSTKILLVHELGMDAEGLKIWLHSWRYHNSDIKVRVLFARVLQLSFVDGELIKTPFHHNIAPEDAKKLHLDHMEPSSIDSINAKSYYKYGLIDRGDDVDALGNMFPLPGDLNISKSNAPMYTVFQYLNKSGLGNHWLTQETKTLFDSNCQKIDTTNVPTQEFFTKRKEYLIRMFDKAIRLQL